MSIFKKIFGKISGSALGVENTIDQYLKSLHENLERMHQHIGNMRGIADEVMRVRNDGREYAETLRRIKDDGDAAILENAPRLQPIADNLRIHQQTVSVLINQTQMAHEQLRDRFKVLAAAGLEMPQLTAADKKLATDALDALSQHGDQLWQMADGLTADNKETENIIAQAIKNTAQRTQKAKFNDALQNGLAVKKMVAAPRTARFKAKAKPIPAPAVTH